MERVVFRLPDVGEGVAEAEIADWHVDVGSTVREDDPLVDMMTDKATVEITSPISGTVVELYGKRGEKRPTGSELVVFEVDGSGISAPLPTSSVPTPPERPPVPAKMMGPAPTALPPANEFPQAAPATRRLAYQAGIDLHGVTGTGPGGRITPDDLQSIITSGGLGSQSSSSSPRNAVEEVPVIGLRRAIGERLQDTKRRVPHFTYVEEIDMTALEELRKALNARYTGKQPRLTILPFLIRAIAVTVPDFPTVNANFDDVAGIVHRHAAVHTGIATQTASGLLVTVVRHAEALSLWEIASELSRLAGLARAGKAGRVELTGSTITLSSLGPMGGITTTPIVNHPEVAIIGVNKMVERPMIRSGQVVARTMMNLSSSFDHRVVDGWEASSFIQGLRERLEMPATLFMDLP